MAKFAMKISGDKKLLKKLKELPDRIARKVNRQAANKAGTPMLAAVKARVPVDTGTEKRAEQKKVSNHGFYANAIIGVDRNAEGPNGEKPYKYDHLSEFGHVTADGTIVPGHGAYRAAFDASIRQAESIYAREAAAGVEREAMKG